ncbi:MAG TPA: fructosamine kinase family protein [Cyanobium sp.]|nr:fructosamine kinase family protein [Cyanobium sp.]
MLGPRRPEAMAPTPDSLSAWLAEELGVSLVGRTPVGGGCIHSAWCLQLAGGGRLFAKTNRLGALPLLQAEADGLAALHVAAEPAALVVPEPLAVAAVGDRAVLVLPWLELGPGRSGAATRSGNGGWRGFGAALAALHRRSLTTVIGGNTEPATAPGESMGRFGWERDNWIGSGPQPNGWHDHWGRFFAERRLAPQLERLTLRDGPLRGAEELLQQVPPWLGQHGAEPCLVHGDLWSGNAGLLANGRAALFDPAVYRGDREVDLAMARLFGGFPPEFFVAYEEHWSLPPGHRHRVDLYNLYHLLNHANLFGGGYRQQAQACIGALLKEPPG